MSSKAFFILGLLAIFVMISSDVEARELAETSPTTQETGYFIDGHFCKHRCCFKKFKCRCCSAAEAAKQVTEEAIPHN